MLDIRFIRENAELVELKAKQKGYDVSNDIEELLKADSRNRELLQEIEEVRRQRNELAREANQDNKESFIQKGKDLKEEEKALVSSLPEVELYLKRIPNMAAEDVPIGTSENDNVVSREWGNKPSFDFKPKTHWEIAESRGLVDKVRAAKVAGSRFAYVRGNLVKLQFAIIQYTLEALTDKATIEKIIENAGLDVSSNLFIPVLPPLMIKTDVYEAMDRLEPQEDRYKVGDEADNLWLQGSAEHTLGSMFADEILAGDDLPIRYLGYATSFRREAGTYGKDTEGIIRMHQFDKLEMESFTKPEDGMNEHLFMVAVQEYLMQQLKLPYQIIQKCTADIGKPNVRGIDINAWLPGAGKYMETHTADYIGDYQARRLSTRYKKIGDTGADLVHTNDATAFALGRTMVAIIENYQNQDGTISIPEALQPYMGRTVSI